MPSQFVFALKNENQARFFPFGPREMFRFGGAVQCASLSLCHFCLFLALYQRRVRVCGRQEEAQEEHRRGETVAGRERADTGGVQSGWRMVRRDMLFQSFENEI